MGLCCGKEAMRKTDQQIEGHGVGQEQLGFRFHIIVTPQLVSNPLAIVEVEKENESSTELWKPEIGVEKINPHSVLGRPFDDMKMMYTFGEQLGRGQSGITYRCVEKATGKAFACKSILKRKLVSKNDREAVKREVQILERLSRQPNIVKFKGAYEDRQSVHLVMELCEGGQLFDRITAEGHYSEKDAAVILKQIVNVVCVCHSMGVMHRDLKPENFLLSSKDEGSTLKAIDFGLSIFIEEGKVFQDFVGSVYYVAPEVLLGSYGKEIDVWSAGVMLYILLSGFPPFWAETDGGIFDAILDGDIDFESQPWPSISESAKDLVRRMLTRDPSERITVERVLEHPWINVTGKETDEPIRSTVVSRVKQFKANKLKQLILKASAENISTDDMIGLKEVFAGMDLKKTGTITCEELKLGLMQFGSLSESEVQNLMKAHDVTGAGAVDYSEFIAAIMERRKLDKDEQIYRAFQHLDKDNSGDELETAKEKYRMGDASVMEILNEADKR